MSLQEKFQSTMPPKPEKDHEWRTFSSARSTGEAGFAHSNNKDATADITMKTNFMPPGMDISNQRNKRIQNMPLSMAGETDVSNDTNPASFAKGFKRRDMGNTDDQYTGEHQDLFYGSAEDEEGNVGFVERNNYMDRE